MPIRITRNVDGNCINFVGSSNPAYWNGCLSASVSADNPDNLNIINNIRTQQNQETAYEFFEFPHTDFADANGDAFADAQAAADYINIEANVLSGPSLAINYQGVYDPVTGLPDLAAGTYDNADWLVSVGAGTVVVGTQTLVLEPNDQLRYDETNDVWDVIPDVRASINDINQSAITQFDIHVDPTYTGTQRTGSALQPYVDLSVAIANSNENNSILIKGEVVVPNSATDAFVLPHGLKFYGNATATVRYVSYDSTNGDVFHFTGTDSTQAIYFENITIKNAGGYGIFTTKAGRVDVIDCTLENNGWSGNGLNTVLASATSGVLGYDSTQAELQAFWAGTETSNGGAMRLEESPVVSILGNTVKNNLRGIRVQDCGINGGGFITRNQVSSNIESGIYIAAGTLAGCHNIVTTINSSAYNSNNGLLCIGGINNKFSQNEVNGNWNAGFCAWGSANATLRDCGLYDNNRSAYNGIGNTGDAKASIQINEAYNLLGTSITVNPAFRFIAEVLDTQVHYTGLGSNTNKIGFLITSDVGALADNDKNIIKVDDVGFIGQDYAIDFSEVDMTNLRMSLGDNSYQSIGIKAVNGPVAGNYSELPFSNHIMSVPEVDIVIDTLKQTVALHEGVGGHVINVYNTNELQSVLKATTIDIIQRASNRIQLRDLTLGNVYINGVVAGTNLSTLNDSLNAAFTMDLTEYKDFIETEVGVIGEDNAKFYYIESPDGVFHYPLFKTESEANTVDVELGGTAPGTSHTHTYADDTTGTTWYMPTTSNHMSVSAAPLNGLYTAPNGGEIESVVWNIQTTDADADHLPTFTNITYNVQEGTVVNVVYKAAGMTETFNLTNVPAGYADDGYAIIGTAEDITNGAGNSVQHVINVTKANAFGSVQGTITINVLANLAGNEFTIVDQGGAIKFTQDGGITVLDFNTVTFNAGTTYKFFVDGTTMQTNDVFDVVDVNGNTITSNDGLTQSGSGPGYAGTYFQYAIPADVAPGKFLKFIDGATSTTYANVPMTIAGSTYTANPTGITLEGPTANQTGSNVMDQYDHGWISLNEQLSAGERLVLDNAFFADFLAEVKGNNTIFAIGLKGENWTNTKEVNSNGAAAQGLTFKGNTYIVGIWSSSASSVTMWVIASGVASNSMYLNSQSYWPTVCAFLEVTADGDNIRAGFGRNGHAGVTQGDESTVTYDNWNSYKKETGDQNIGFTSADVMMSFWTYNGDTIDGDEIDWTGIKEVSIPVPPTSNSTSWNKALDFSGGNEHAKQSLSASGLMPISTTAGTVTLQHANGSGTTSSSAYANPWAVACVFKQDGNQSIQHIWNQGEGAGSTDDNVYLRLKPTGPDTSTVVFGWGRSGALNEVELLNIGASYNLSVGTYWGVYVGFNGTRLSGNDATASNLADCFDFKMVTTNDLPQMGNIHPVATNTASRPWTSTGGRMDRAIIGDFTIGGRGGNRNFHGNVASCVVTTLKCGEAMPTDAEAYAMLTDPVGWVNDYKVGSTYRSPVNTGLSYNFQVNNTNSSYGTQVWLMGDGTNDTYPNVMNYVEPNTIHTGLVMQSMLSNDIVNVTIPGL
jgi:hypothetical protein